MAQQTNIPVENERNYRDIKRNTSNQIVSYTLPTDDSGLTEIDYGINKLNGITLKYEKDGFNRTVGGLSNELKMTLPDVPLSVIEMKRINESNIYTVQGNTLVSITGDEVGDEVVDVFSGRYELTPKAASYRDAETELWMNTDNTHFSGISFINETVRNITNNYISYGGHKNIEWDGEVYGPPLQQFGYRVTKELIDSGRNLNLRAMVGFNIHHGNLNDVGAYVAFRRKRAGNVDSSSYRMSTMGQTYLGSDQPTYPMLQPTLVIANNQLVENDLYQVTTNVGSASPGVYIYGNKCIFEVTCQLPEEPPINWPPMGANASYQATIPNNDAVVVPVSNTVS